MWLDRAFVSFRYAFSFGNGKGGRLPGQSEPVVGFLDPSWTALMTAVQGMGLQPVRAVQIIGPVLFGLLLALCAHEIWRRHRRLLPLLPVVVLGAAAPAAAAARSGTDDLWLALWSVLAVVWAGVDAEGAQGRWRTLGAVVGVCLTGWFGLLLGSGIAVVGWRARIRSWAWAVFSVLALVFVGSMVFGFTSSPAILLRLSTPTLANWLEALQCVPILLGLGLLGVAATGLGEARTRLLVWGVLVWLGYALSGPVDVGPLAASVVPLLGLIALLGAEALGRIRRARWAWMAVLLALIFDIYGPQTAWAEASKSRRAELRQTRDMARFLRWRFGPSTTVAVHTPGSLAYHWGRPVIDMSGTTESTVLSPTQVMEMRPEAIMPPSNLVASQIIRVSMGAAWGKEIYDGYDLHSIQHQRKWGLVRFHPAFFLLYIRNDLPRLAPEISVEEGNRFPKE